MFDTAITWTTDGASTGVVSYRKGRFYSTNVNGVLISDNGYTNQAISKIFNLEAWEWVSHVGNPKLMNTIVLYQRKLDMLKEQKKVFLQKNVYIIVTIISNGISTF